MKNYSKVTTKKVNENKCQSHFKILVDCLLSRFHRDLLHGIRLNSKQQYYIKTSNFVKTFRKYNYITMQDSFLLFNKRWEK